MSSLRHTLRALLKTPGFTATALATLALCLGANLTIFAVVDAVLLRPLPFPEADRLVTVFNGYPNIGYPRTQTSIANYFDRRGTIGSFASVSIQRDETIILGGTDAPSRVPIARISPEFFTTLEVPLAMGRTFTEDELAPGADAVAIITDGFWYSHFSADNAVLGRTFLNDGVPITIIGVLPRSFRFLSSPAEFYRPAAYAPKMRQAAARHVENYNMFARLAPGATVAAAQSEIDAFNVIQATEDIHPDALVRMGYHTVVAPLQADHVHAVAPTLILLECGALALLLIGATNLANLLLIRASGRSKELVVRRALGASARHIAAGVLGETTLLALAGGLLGLLLGAFGIQMLATLGAGLLPVGATIAINGWLATLSLLAAVAVGLLLAVPIIWFSVRAKLAPGLQIESRGGTASRPAQRLRHGFIVVQIALAMVLLTAAGLLGLTLERVLQTTTGFNPDHLLTAQVTLPAKQFPDTTARVTFIDRLLPTLQALPGVTRAAINNSPPFVKVDSDRGIAVEGFTHASGDNLRVHHFSGVSADYFATMRIPLRDGRRFEEADQHGAQRICVVDENVARHYWPDRSPLGGRLEFGDKVPAENAITVVGVVAAVKQEHLTEASDIGNIYVPCSQFKFDTFTVVLRTVQAPAALTPTIRRAIRQLDGNIVIEDFKTMEARIDDSLVPRRSPAILAGLFAAVALLLAAIGTYGVLAYAVSQRRREIGVRMALGALPRQVLTQFLGLGARLLVLGIILGVPGALATGRGMRSLLLGVGAFPVGLIAITAGVLSVVVLVAVLLPSQRAARVNPLDALRDD